MAIQPPKPDLSYDFNVADVAEQNYLDKNAIAKDDTYVSRLSTMYPAPKPYTPKQEQQTRNAASMAETLKSLAEIYGQSKGAFLQKREPIESAKAENRILYDKNKYDADLREYARAMVGAMGQDSEEVRRLRENARRYGQTIAEKDYLAKKAQWDRQNKITDDENKNKFTAGETDKKIKATATQKELDRSNSTKNAQIRSEHSGNKKAKEKYTADIVGKAMVDTNFQKYLISKGVLTQDEITNEIKRNPLMPSNSDDKIAEMYTDWLNSKEGKLYSSGAYRATSDGVGYKKGDWVRPKNQPTQATPAQQKQTPAKTTKKNNNTSSGGLY